MKRKLVAAAVLAVFGATAHAEDFNLGLLGSAVTPLFNIVSGGFLDTYAFTLDAPATVTGSIFANNFATFNIVAFSVSVQSGVPPGTIAGPDVTPGVFSFDLPAGSYGFQVFGAATGASGGIYSGVIQAISAVPEPETYAMMLAGLGIVGFVAARRRSQG